MPENFLKMPGQTDPCLKARCGENNIVIAVILHKITVRFDLGLGLEHVSCDERDFVRGFQCGVVLLKEEKQLSGIDALAASNKHSLLAHMNRMNEFC